MFVVVFGLQTASADAESAQRGDQSERQAQEEERPADANQDGYVSLDEFMALRRSTSTAQTRRRRALLFQQLDIDRDGRLSPRELEHFGAEEH